MEPAGRPTPRPIWEFWLRPPELDAEPAAVAFLGFVEVEVGFVVSVEVGIAFVEEVAAASLLDGEFCWVKSPGELPVGLAGAPIATGMLDDPAETVDVAVAWEPPATAVHWKTTATKAK